MNDKTLGYIILILLCFLMGWALVYGVWYFVSPKNNYSIIFPQVGNLRIQDPVETQGVVLGIVTEMETNNNKVVVTIETEKPLILANDYLISTHDRGLMGDRVIEIHTGSATKKIIKNRDTLKGEFNPGIAEMLGHVHRLQEIISQGRTMARSLLTADSKKRIFTNQLISFVNKIDSASIRLDKFVALINTKTTPAIFNFQKFTIEAHRKTTSMGNFIPSNLDTLAFEIDRMTKFVQRASGAIDSLSPFLTTLQKESLIPTQQLDRIRSLLTQLNWVITQIDSNAIPLKVYPFW